MNRGQDLQEWPFVSIVMPTYNRAGLMAESVGSLRRQEYPQDRFEIIVVDDGSSDATAIEGPRLEDSALPRVRYIRQERKGPNGARNAGLAVAQGDPVCLVDDDIEAPPGWLKALVAGALRHEEAGAVGGPIRLRFEGRSPRFCGREPLVGEAEFDLGQEERDVREVISANMAIRSWAVRKVGAFDESLPIYGDELEWLRRLNRAELPIMYIPSAPLWHRRVDLKLISMLRKYFRRGLHIVVFCRRVGETQDLSITRSVRALVLSLAHGLRRGCAMGLLMAGQQLGVIWGLLTGAGHDR